MCNSLCCILHSSHLYLLYPPSLFSEIGWAAREAVLCGLKSWSSWDLMILATRRSATNCTKTNRFLPYRLICLIVTTCTKSESGGVSTVPREAIGRAQSSCNPFCARVSGEVGTHARNKIPSGTDCISIFHRYRTLHKVELLRGAQYGHYVGLVRRNPAPCCRSGQSCRPAPQ